MDRYEHWLSPLARFHEAPWYYLLTGADFKKDALPDYIRVSAVVEVAGQAVLCRGTLDDWFVNSDNGQLDRLVLSAATRRPFAKDKQTDGDGDERFYKIDGDYFVLRFESVISLNVQYVKFKESQRE